MKAALPLYVAPCAKISGAAAVNAPPNVDDGPRYKVAVPVAVKLIGVVPD